MPDIPVHDHSADRAYQSLLRRSAPTEARAFVDFNRATVGREDGEIPRKYRELIAIAVATTTQCKYCLSSHTATFRELGGTVAEVAEAAFIASALRAGAAYTHGMVAVRYFQDAGATPVTHVGS